MPTSSVRQPSPVPLHPEPQFIAPPTANMQAQSPRVLRAIDAVENELRKLSNPIMSNAQLSSLGFARAASLPLDQGPMDTRGLFFAPYPDGKSRELYMGIMKMYADEDAEYLNYCDRQHQSGACPHLLYTRIAGLLSWAKYTRLAGWKGTTSVCAKDPHHQRAATYNGYYNDPTVYGDHAVFEIPVWRMADASYLPGKPHVRCIIADSTVARGDEVLRSELVCALQLMQHQMKCTRYGGSVVPVLVFSIGHTNVGRVTQIHFDWASSKFVLRQTRLLNFVPASGDETDRTVDDWCELAYLFRWLEATPIGKTQVGT